MGLLPIGQEISPVRDSGKMVIDDAAKNEPAEQGLEEMGMLIRAASSFLAITDSFTEAKAHFGRTDPDYKALINLNRIATLFITKDTAEVAAVMSATHQGGTQVFGVGAPSSNSESQNITTAANIETNRSGYSDFYVTKNSVGNDMDRTGRIPPPVLLPSTVSKDDGICTIIAKYVNPYVVSS